MSGISDLLERMIKEMLEDNDGVIEFSRSELAGRANCVPSQINYVLSTRFKNSMGYAIYSRRGGSGSIRIERVADDEDKLPYWIRQIGFLPDSLTQHQAHTLIREWIEQERVELLIARIMQAITSHQALMNVSASQSGKLRADLLKQVMTILALDEQENKTRR